MRAQATRIKPPRVKRRTRTGARHRSFTRAARELLLTQPAVSAQVRALTELLGGPLLEQHGKTIHLTAAGHSLLERAGRIEAVVREIGEMFAGYRGGETGTVLVGASASIGTYFFPAVALFRVFAREQA